MKYIIFPAYQADEVRPSLSEYLDETIICSGPTQSGLYLVECSSIEAEILKFLIQPHYLLMEDFEDPTIH